MALHDRIREQRKQHGISQETVAESLGVSRQAVTKWESGQSAPSTEHLIRLAELFGTTVDALVASDDTIPTVQAEQIEAPSIQTQSAGRRIRWQQMLRRVLAVLGGYAVIYLAGRVFGTTAEQFSIMGWLFGTDPQQHTYLYGWLLHQNLFWIAMAVSLLVAVAGKPWASGITTLGFGTGLLLGELFGANPAGAALGQSHYGWVIWAGIYFLFLVAGFPLERMIRQGICWRSRRFWIWTGILLLGTLMVILLVRSSF